MRRIRFLVVASGLAMAGVAGWTAGCTNTDCKNYVTCKADEEDVALPPPVACKGDPRKDSALLKDDCAVFVQADASSAGEGEGTLEAPLKSLQVAITAATAGSTRKWVIACASGEFKETVLIGKNPVSIYGGFDCSDPMKWVWSEEKKTALTGPANAVTLTIAASTATELVDIQSFAITAAASAVEKKGGSSIAVIVDGRATSLTSCTITAGDASDGQDGASGPMDPPAQPMKTAKNDGLNACSALGENKASGGATFANDCGNGANSIGGSGGAADRYSGDTGQQGTSKPPTAQTAAAGLGDVACGSGGTGGIGGPGDQGASGEHASGAGTLDRLKGWNGGAGKDG